MTIYLFLANEMDGREYQRKVPNPMLMLELMMVVVEEMERKVEAKYVEKDYLKASSYCLYPLTASLVTALQRS